jgi:Protein of unknown function (DUF3365)
MTKMYGKNNGFGWKLNDLIGAQIVSVPARLVNESAGGARLPEDLKASAGRSEYTN